jgi:hypothetical protein
MKCKCSVFAIVRAAAPPKSSVYRGAISVFVRPNTGVFNGYTQRHSKCSQDKADSQYHIYISFSLKQDVNHVTNLKQH